MKIGMAQNNLTRGHNLVYYVVKKNIVYCDDPVEKMHLRKASEWRNLNYSVMANGFLNWRV